MPKCIVPLARSLRQAQAKDTASFANSIFPAIVSISSITNLCIGCNKLPPERVSMHDNFAPFLYLNELSGGFPKVLRTSEGVLNLARMTSSDSETSMASVGVDIHASSFGLVLITSFDSETLMLCFDS